MNHKRKRDIFITCGLLIIMTLAIWFSAGREQAFAAGPSTTKTVEAPAVNLKEKETIPSEEEVMNTPQPTTQETMLREENLRATRDNAIRNLKDSN